MITDWASFTGLTVGPWRLDSLLGARDGRAYFLLTDTTKAEKALLQVILASDAAAEKVRRSWQLAAGLPDPGMVRVYETADTEFDGVPVCYSIQELPEDDLAELLTTRAVDIAEARAMASSVAGALDTLHRRGLCHGAVTPSSVLLVKEQVKLAADTLAETRAPADRQSDIRQFGLTLVEAVTGDQDPASARRLPPPLREVAVGCLAPPGRQWDTARIVRALGSESAAVAASEPAAAAELVVAPSHPEEASAAPAIASGRRVLYAGVAAFVVLATFGYRAMKNPREAETRPLRQPVQAAEPVGRVSLPAPARAEPIEKPSPIHPAARRYTGSADRLKGPDRWAVIAATYKDFGMAQKRAAQLSTRPHIDARVFPPEGDGSRYYVVLGSGMSRQAADELLRTARNAGAPADSYVTMLK